MKRGRGRANCWEITTFGWCSELISIANKGPLAANDAAYLAAQPDKAATLARSFDEAYAKFKVREKQQRDLPSPIGILWTNLQSIMVSIILILNISMPSILTGHC